MTSDVRAALDAGDDGFHEIQLNGKQLVFLGMATTLVSVVIFLCGVLVGRGVKPLDTVAQAAGPQAFDTPVTQRRSRPARSPLRPRRRRRRPARPAAGPRSPRGRGRRTRRRYRADAARRRTRPVGARAGEPTSRPLPRPSRPPSNRRRPKVEPREAGQAEAGAGPGDASAAVASARSGRRGAEADAGPGRASRPTAPASAGGAIAVQVGAFATRKEADALAKRLSGRGYAVYVMNPTGDGKNVYRVRVGNYGTADEAQRVSARLTQQENLKPWITR